ncbi:hypothetical protein DFH06DRAFT_1482481 [Mycena polygramma]|nr:hypothetical protein DFH06DRAFT_1482481 [Mycena polygramma]
MDQDPETPPVDYDKDDPTHDAAAAPMWAVYVSEAEKYDRSLVESWKSDMEGMLIFAGLFSASLTAFLIESYKTLVPDPGDTTTTLLAQISLQLAASANGTTYHVPPPASFTPPTTSLICNVLWFISLGLSLTCALIATLLEQWARDFLHRADMRSAPVIRARVFSFLYYGLKRFRMHTVVEIIPLLLHASLLLFFVGLVAFLIPVNIAITVVVAVILLTVITAYALLTLLPLLHLDCPYRTPLSSGLWRLGQKLWTALPYCRFRVSNSEQEGESMVEAVFREAMKASEKRSTRDQNSLSWTLKSLADDNELEPFVEALPDLIWAPHRPAEMLLGGSAPPELERRWVYDDHMRCLMDYLKIGLLNRLEAFGNSCSRGILRPEVQTRRQIALYKAVWALSCLSTPGSSGFRIPLVWNVSVAPEARLYQESATAMQQWANLRAAQVLLEETSRHLIACKRTMTAKQRPDTTRVFETVLKLHSEYNIFWFHTRFKPFPKAIEQSHIDAWIEEIRVLPLNIYLNFLSYAVESESKPYRFDITLSLITPKFNIPPSNKCIGIIEHGLQTMISKHSRLFETAEGVHWLDQVFAKILSHFEPPDLTRLVKFPGSQRSLPVFLPSALVQYLNTRQFHHAVCIVVYALPPRAWGCIAGTIAPWTDVNWPVDRPPVDHCLTALWRIFSVASPLPVCTDVELLEGILRSVCQTNVPSITPSVIALGKILLLSALQPTEQHTGQHISPAIMEEIVGKNRDEYDSPEDLWDDAVVQIVTEFIGCCCTSDLPYKAADTLRLIGYCYPRVAHPISQLEFATAVMKLCKAALDSRFHDTLVQEILNMPLFQYPDDGEVDCPHHTHGLPRWLTDSEARNTIRTALTSYLEGLSTAGDSPKVVQFVEKLLAKLNMSAQEQELSEIVDVLGEIDPATLTQASYKLAPTVNTEPCFT